MHPTLDALFPTATDARIAVEQLMAAGFAEADIQVATRATLRAAHVALPAAAAEAPAGPDSALVSVRVAPGPAADQARELLARHGATDVRQPGGTPGGPVAGPGLAGGIALLRDAPNLDANGLTTP